MDRLKLAPNDQNLTEAIGPLVLDNAQPAADVCGGAVTANGVTLPPLGTYVTAPWGSYLVTDGLGWGVAAHWWVDEHLT